VRFFVRIGLNPWSTPLHRGVALVFFLASRRAVLSFFPVLFLLAEGIVLFLAGLLFLIILLRAALRARILFLCPGTRLLLSLCVCEVDRFIRRKSLTILDGRYQMLFACVRDVQPVAHSSCFAFLSNLRQTRNPSHSHSGNRNKIKVFEYCRGKPP
jgi:hypothetical protein